MTGALATLIGFIALVAVASHLGPYVTRRDIFFGVTVSPAFRDGPAGHAIARRYAVEIWLIAIVAAALAATSPVPTVSGPMLLAQTAAASVAFLNARRAVRPHGVAPAMVREAAVGPRQGLPGGVIGQLGPFLILFVAAVYVAMHWEDIPARFPTHWNLSGKPDGWTSKSFAGVFRGTLVGVFACSMTLFTSYAVVNWTRLPRVTGREGLETLRVRRANLVAMLASEYLIASVIAWVSIVSRFATDARDLRLPLAFRVAPFALMIVATVSIRVMRRVAAFGAPPVGDTTPDSCWIFGRLYFNRMDPALFVEKRMGPGYTLNLGNPVSWLVVMVEVTALFLALWLVA